MLVIRRTVSAAIFFLFAAVIFGVAAYYSSVVDINSDGITRTTLFFIKKTKPWSEISEVGVCGTKIFNIINKKKTGTIYFYTSSKKMDDDECFQMLLRWPPKGEIVFKYGSDALNAVQYYYQSKIKLYNTGNLILEEKRKA